MGIPRPACAAPRAPAMNKESVNQKIILGEELNLPVIGIVRNPSAATWSHSTADLWQRNCCPSAKCERISWQRRENGALGIRYPPSRQYLIISAITTLPVGYPSSCWTAPTTLPALFQPRCRVGGPQLNHCGGRIYHHLHDVCEGLNRSYLFGVCLFVMLKDRSERKEVHRKRQQRFCSEVKPKLIFGV